MICDIIYIMLNSFKKYNKYAMILGFVQFDFWFLIYCFGLFGFCVMRVKAFDFRLIASEKCFLLSRGGRFLDFFSDSGWRFILCVYYPFFITTHTSFKK